MSNEFGGLRARWTIERIPRCNRVRRQGFTALSAEASAQAGLTFWSSFAGPDHCRGGSSQKNKEQSLNFHLKNGVTPLVFTIDLVVRTTEYRIDKILFHEERILKENLFREKLTVRTTITSNVWNIRYIFSDDEWGEKLGKDVKSDSEGVYISLSSKKGFKGKFYLDIQPWQ